ncbi:hypothetical protein [Chryseobacterium caseinilyticum]|uniref:Exostosin GT47 domain-containing protein n=1 Tax=Chryseobacterium caseinilyticum TaxID=2771428 RepID=A0ABR8ZG96_9FLAO|nr:hypothetical protein [Chryseobacterium caseinilyticum]MBD8084321.1 hypothetical protein [Chryseobacterium caseinilyticum]
MIKKIRLLKALLHDSAAFIRLKLKTTDPNSKALLVNFENPQLYHRFFYTMLKFYRLAGYTVFYPMSFSTFRNLRNKDRYLSLIVREDNFLDLNVKNLPEDFVEITDRIFSPDYFSDYFDKKNNTENSFHVPMSFHPFMYNQEIWDLNVDTERKRFNAIFCYGNFDSKAYLDIKKTDFKVIPRTELLKFFQNKDNYLEAFSEEKITSKSKEELDRKYVFAIKENYGIAMNDVREHLSYFNFYLCCPGVVMPLCHNVIEAMSVGTIPLIEKEYAQVMYPNLQDRVNAIIFDDLEHLNQILADKLFNLSEEEISSLKKNVLEYYKKYLTPEGVVKNINNSIHNKKLIYLQAEHRSVKFKK